MNQAIAGLLGNGFVRFLMSGGVNTALTYGLYLALLMILPYMYSYTIAYVSGIILSYLLNRFFVFKDHRGIKSALLLPVIYAGQYALSLIIIWTWVEWLGLNQKFAPLIAIALTVPATFLFSKFAFSKKP